MLGVGLAALIIQKVQAKRQAGLNEQAEKPTFDEVGTPGWQAEALRGGREGGGRERCAPLPVLLQGSVGSDGAVDARRDPKAPRRVKMNSPLLASPACTSTAAAAAHPPTQPPPTATDTAAPSQPGRCCCAGVGGEQVPL